MSGRAMCDECRRPCAICLCDDLLPLLHRIRTGITSTPSTTTTSTTSTTTTSSTSTTTTSSTSTSNSTADINCRVLVVQHPKEHAEKPHTGTLPLLSLILPANMLSVHVAKRITAADPCLQDFLASVQRPLLLFPRHNSQCISTAITQSTATTQSTFDTSPSSTSNGAQFGIIVLDGTWTQCKSIYARSPTLHQFPSYSLPTSTHSESIYHIMRKEPAPGCMSTAEAVASALRIIDSPHSEPFVDAIHAAIRALVKKQLQFLPADHIQQRLAFYSTTPSVLDRLVQ